MDGGTSGTVYGISGATLGIGAPATYSGVTNVLDGTLVLNGEGTLAQTPTAVVNAVQTITFGGTITGGTASTFTLSLDGATTAAIAYSSSATGLQQNIQTALAAWAPSAPETAWSAPPAPPASP